MRSLRWPLRHRRVVRSVARVLAALGLAFVVSTGARSEPAILILGDSLSAAYGMRLEDGWVALLEARLAGSQAPYRVINASISGDTTHGGLTRLSAALERHAPSVVVVELGANDGLRGLALEHTRGNLSEIVRRCRASQARVLLLGMRLPVNFGPYADAFYAMYGEIARETGVALVPFFLDGVGDRPELLQADGLHPTPEAQPRLVDNVWGHLAPLL